MVSNLVGEKHTNLSCRAMWTDAKEPDPRAAPLSRQASIYSLTFDEFQNTIGGIGNDGKDFGSMNMEEFLKNLWTAEEGQAMVTTLVGPDAGPGALQRQGSLTLPGNLCEKTVDDVWRGLTCDNIEGASVPDVPRRQPTLGEMTLEEFLVRAGVVREEIKPINPIKPIDNNANSNVYYGDMSMPASGNNNSTFTFTFPQVDQSNLSVMQKSLHGFPVEIKLPPPVGPPSVNQISYEGRNGALSSSSPAPYMFNGGLRGQKGNGAVEKVVERRQRRMIKNRESAARSRARKQAYTVELEAEIGKLKEKNEELQKKQVELLKIQKNQVLKQLNEQLGPKKLCLRRTQTGRW